MNRAVSRNVPGVPSQPSVRGRTFNSFAGQAVAACHSMHIHDQAPRHRQFAMGFLALEYRNETVRRLQRFFAPVPLLAAELTYEHAHDLTRRLNALIGGSIGRDAGLPHNRVGSGKVTEDHQGLAELRQQFSALRIVTGEQRDSALEQIGGSV